MPKFKPSYTSQLAESIMAEHLIHAQAVEFLVRKPMRLKSGLIAPVYVDNRKLYYYPEIWSDVVETMTSRVEEFGLDFDLIAGVESAGSLHAGGLAYRLQNPAVILRDTAKTYGDKSRIEGGDVKGKHVLLIEDHISTGLSALDAISYLRNSGAVVTDLISITNYQIPETMRLFEEAQVKAYEVISFPFVVDKACELGIIDEEHKKLVMQWLKTPWTWAAIRGIVPIMHEN